MWFLESNRFEACNVTDPPTQKMLPAFCVVPLAMMCGNEVTRPREKEAARASNRGVGRFISVRNPRRNSHEEGKEAGEGGGREEK